MEGQSLTLFFGFSGGALVLLFLVVLWQKAQLVHYEQELNQASLNLAKQRGSHTQILPPLLEEAPFPICYTDLTGKILTASKGFYSLAGSKVGHLDDFAKATGAQLASKNPPKRQQRISLQSHQDETLRHFSLTSWPAQGSNGPIGRVYSLLEHTAVVRHRNEEHLFTQELLKLEAELLENIQNEPGNTALISELTNLTAFIQKTMQPQRHQSFETFDIVELIQRSLLLYKPHFRKQNVAVTSTLPRELFAVGYADESLEVINLVLAAIAEHAPERSSIRLHVGKAGKHVHLSLSFPGLHYNGSLNDFFSFGSKKIQRQSQVRVALARLLMGIQHGNLALTADDENVIVAELSFVAAKQRE